MQHLKSFAAQWTKCRSSLYRWENRWLLHWLAVPLSKRSDYMGKRWDVADWPYSKSTDLYRCWYHWRWVRKCWWVGWWLHITKAPVLHVIKSTKATLTTSCFPLSTRSLYDWFSRKFNLPYSRGCDHLYFDAFTLPKPREEDATKVRVLHPHYSLHCRMKLAKMQIRPLMWSKIFG